MPAEDGGPASLRIAACGPEQAAVVHHLTQEAFRVHASLEPPSSAGGETLDAVRMDLASGGAVARLDGRPAGCLRCAVEGDHLHVRRVAVLPELQGRGIGTALMAWAEARAADLGLAAVTVGVRLALPGNLRLYRRLGYGDVALRCHPGWDRPTWLAMRKPVSPR